MLSRNPCLQSFSLKICHGFLHGQQLGPLGNITHPSVAIDWFQSWDVYIYIHINPVRSNKKLGDHIFVLVQIQFLF